MKPLFAYARPRRQSGFNLIELMISMLLGLLVVGAAIGIFISNRRTYSATEGLSRIQEAARTGFEMMAQDIREAGGNQCDSGLPVVNVLTNPTNQWWTNWAMPLSGYENGGPSDLGIIPPSKLADRSDVIQILSAGTGGATVIKHDPVAQTLTLNAPAPDLHANAIMLLCDRQQLAVLQVATVAGINVTYAKGGLNACAQLGRLPSVCATGANNYTFEMNSILSELRAVRWYVATASSNVGTSLYQQVIGPNGASAKNEIAEGVTSLNFQYLLTGAAAYVDANAVGNNWANVVAVRIAMIVSSNDSVAAGQKVVTRNFSTTVSIRNRNP